MKSLNILFSSTRQWNPGDEFILYGIRNVLNDIGVEYNAIIFNRSPEIRKTFSYLNPLFAFNVNNRLLYLLDRTIGSFFRIGFSDNSFKEFLDNSYVDLVIFAGSPEWWGRRLVPLYSLIEKRNLPTIFLGIGTHGKKLSLSQTEKKVLKNSKLITVRDEKTMRELQMYNPKILPCPAILSANGEEKRISEVKRVGIIYSDYRSTIYNHISKDVFLKITKLYSKIEDYFRAKKIEVEYICHYIDELSYIREFTSCPYRYSYESRDYISIYKSYDLIIGTRVHGIGVGASLGIPGIYISHDARSQTVKGFKSLQVFLSDSYDDIVNKIENIMENIANYNSDLLVHKKKTLQDYRKVLLPIFRDLKK